MKKLVDVPMRDLKDAFDWHVSQVDRFENLQRQHKANPLNAGMPKMLARKLKESQKKIDFHQSIVNVMQMALTRMATDNVKFARLENRIRELEAA